MQDEAVWEPRYNNDFFQNCQRQLDEAVVRGISKERLEDFFVKFHREQSKIINPLDVRNVSMGTLERNILRPRQDLYFFILHNWIRHIFIPGLEARLAKNLLVFGIGRIFSAYNDIGVQYCTDADLNFVLADSIPNSDIKDLNASVKRMKQIVWDLFNIIIEVDSSFTVLKVSDIKKRLAHDDLRSRLAATLFYKGNAKSLFVIFDNPDLRSEVFGQVDLLPDALLFDNFIGDNPVKTTFSRLRDDIVQLTVISDDTRQKESVETLIGARTFLHRCRHLSVIHPELYPPNWCFSMKYTVNRIYDYVSAMLHSGHSLTELGFSGPRDCDWNFLCQAHKLMLYLQELIHIRLDSFNNLCDYSYITAERFTDFMDTTKGSFRKDFDGIVLSPNFLLESQRKRYLDLQQAVKRKQELRISLTEDQVKLLSELFGFRFHHLDRGSGDVPVSVPYSWGGLGFFVFSAVEGRLSSIVDTKLVPALEPCEKVSVLNGSLA